MENKNSYKRSNRRSAKNIPENIDFDVTSPAGKHLFEVDKKAEWLDIGKSKIFHSITVKLLYVMKWSRSDIETAISFLCCRVTKRDEDDLTILKRVLAFLKGTINDERIIGMNKEEEMKL